MEICRECLGLLGAVWDDFGRCERIQRCACEPKEPLWRGYDFNRAVELCRLCGVETVRSGSRWRLYFCADCKRHVDEQNQRAKMPLIPIGRHSIVCGVGVSSLASAEEQRRFEIEAASLIERMHQLERWHRAQVRSVVDEIPGGAPKVPLEAYVAAARERVETARAKVDSIVRLLRGSPGAG